MFAFAVPSACTHSCSVPYLLYLEELAANSRPSVVECISVMMKLKLSHLLKVTLKLSFALSSPAAPTSVLALLPVFLLAIPIDAPYASK